jgi:hypothetical protein
LKKARRFLWGNDNVTTTAKSNVSASLFGDRKNNNLFNGIWRLPLSEVDRAGSFSAHMAKCINSLTEMANMTNDHSILLEISIQLRKPPNSDQKYLYEKQRRAYVKQAYVSLKRVLRSKANDSIKSKPKEAQLALLLEIHQIFVKLRKTWQTKDEAVVALMTDLYKNVCGTASATFEEVNTFCNRANTVDRTASARSTVPRGGAGGGTDTVSSLLKANRDNTSGGSKPGAASTTATYGMTDAAQMAAAIDYVNAASYYNELMSSMMTSGTSSAASTTYAAGAQAYLSAYAAAATASYNSLLTNLPTSISVSKADKPKASPSSGSTKPAPSLGASVSVTKTKPTAVKSGAAGSSSLTIVKKSDGGARSFPQKQPLISSGSAKLSSATSGASLSVSNVIVSQLGGGGKKVGEIISAKQPHMSMKKIPPTVSVTMKSSHDIPSSSSSSSSVSITPISLLKTSSTVVAHTKVSGQVRAAAVASANELLIRERAMKKFHAIGKLVAKSSSKPSSVATATTKKLTPAQDALAKLKTFRTTLPNSLKKVPPKAKAKGKPMAAKATKPSSSVASSASGSSGVVINLVDDDDVICID